MFHSYIECSYILAHSMTSKDAVFVDSFVKMMSITKCIFFSGIHNVKMSMGSKNFNLNRSQPYDPIMPVALEISSEATLLCFDEFQVSCIVIIWIVMLGYQ
jgi:predicted ATPase